MAVISVSVSASEEQIVSGIPRFITITTNIVSTIFYTLNGTTPTILSSAYTTPIELATNQTYILLSIFATNGIDSSPIITETYQLELGPDLRVPHSGTDAQANSTPQNNLYPFGTPPIQPGQVYLGAQNAGFTTDDPALTEYFTGYDGDGYQTGATNEEPIGVPTKTQPVIYSESNAEGQRGYGIGTFPRHQITTTKAPPEQSVIGSKLFDPKALVIYQDLTKPQDPDLPSFINRANFTLESVNTTRQGNLYFNTALDAPAVSGSFVKAYSNPTTNTTTYYYFDNSNSRWIISTVPTPKNSIDNYASSMVFRRDSQGRGMVFNWIPFKGSWLY